MIKGPFFLGGSGRSGTTLLSKLISSHEDLTITPETRFLVDPGGIFDLLRNCQVWTPYSSHEQLTKFFEVLDSCSESNFLKKYLSKIDTYFGCRSFKISPSYAELDISRYSPNIKENISLLKSKLVKNHAHLKWVGQNAGWNVKRMIPHNPKDIELALREFMDNYFKDVIDAQGSKFYFEKNTWNILFLDEIFKFWPNAKLVVVMRHPLRVIESFRRQSWMPKDVELCAELYSSIISKYLSMSTYYEDRILEVRYEDILEDTTKVMSRIFDFLKISESNNWKDIKVLKESSKINLTYEEIMRIASVPGIVEFSNKWNYDFDNC